jgi:hypothetical protein
VGLVWAVWHLPLFFIVGSYQFGLAFGSPRFRLFKAELVAGSVLYTWLFLKTDHSTISAVAFHFSQNATAELFELSVSAERIRFLMVVMLAGLIALNWLRGREMNSNQAYPPVQLD